MKGWQRVDLENEETPGNRVPRQFEAHRELEGNKRGEA